MSVHTEHIKNGLKVDKLNKMLKKDFGKELKMMCLDCYFDWGDGGINNLIIYDVSVHDGIIMHAEALNLMIQIYAKYGKYAYDFKNWGYSKEFLTLEV